MQLSKYLTLSIVLTFISIANGNECSCNPESSHSMIASIGHTKPLGPNPQDIMIFHTHLCGGIVLSDRWVLTAASCVKGYEMNPKELIGVGAFSDDLIEIFHNGRVPVASVWIHPNYTRALDHYNFALLHMSRKLTRKNGGKIQIPCFAESGIDTYQQQVFRKRTILNRYLLRIREARNKGSLDIKSTENLGVKAGELMQMVEDHANNNDEDKDEVELFEGPLLSFGWGSNDKAVYFEAIDEWTGNGTPLQKLKEMQFSDVSNSKTACQYKGNEICVRAQLTEKQLIEIQKLKESRNQIAIKKKKQLFATIEKHVMEGDMIQQLSQPATICTDDLGDPLLQVRADGKKVIIGIASKLSKNVTNWTTHYCLPDADGAAFSRFTPQTIKWLQDIMDRDVCTI